MKKLLTIIGLVIINQSYAQRIEQQYLQVNAGIVSNAAPGFVNIEYGRTLKQKSVVKWGLWYEKSAVKTTESSSGLFMVDYLYRKSLNKFSLSGGVGLFGGMESLYSSRNEISVKNFVLGPKMMLQLDYMFSEKIGASINCGELFVLNSDYGSMYSFAGIGINYKL